LAKILHADFNAELRLMVANDRRADKGVFEIHYLFVNDRENWYAHATKNLTAEDPTIDSMATFYYPASRFEREIKDLFGIEAIDHPDTRPLVRHAFWPEDYFPLRKNSVAPEKFDDDGTPFPFKPVGGEGVYEIPVGPVHAGIIEPGHFRFSVVGDGDRFKDSAVFHAQGTEKLFEGRWPIDGVELAERISGDTTIGHALAYRRQWNHWPMRRRSALAARHPAEMERLYNPSPISGRFATIRFRRRVFSLLRIREQLLRLNKRLTGNRLLRGGLVLGGRHDFRRMLTSLLN
jgi:Ni,Fe-hydrogenase III component G